MAEGLSPEAEEEALKFVERDSQMVDHASMAGRQAEEFRSEAKKFQDAASGEARKDLTVGEAEYLDERAEHSLDMAHEWESGKRGAEEARDANLWRAQQHERAHLDEYIESAKQDAAAEGIEVEVSPPADEERPQE